MVDHISQEDIYGPEEDEADEGAIRHGDSYEATMLELKQIYLASRISALALEHPNRLKVSELFECYDPRTVGFTFDELDEETGEKQATECFLNRDNSDLDEMALKMLGLTSQLS